MRCKRIQAWMELEMDGEFPPNRARALAEHLAGCAKCRNEREILHRQEAFLKNLTWPDPGQEFWGGYMGRQKIRRRRSHPPSHPLLGAAMVLSMALAILYLSFHSSLYFRTAPSPGERQCANVHGGHGLPAHFFGCEPMSLEFQESGEWERHLSPAACHSSRISTSMVVHAADCDDGPLVPYLFEMARNEDMRDDAVSQLLDMETPEAVSFFMQLTREPRYRDKAFAALAKFQEPRVFEFLVEKLRQEESRIPALRALKEFRDPAAVPYVLVVLANKDTYPEALDVLKRLALQDTIPPLLGIMERSPESKYAYAALKQLTGEDLGSKAEAWWLWFQKKYGGS